MCLVPLLFVRLSMCMSTASCCMHSRDVLMHLNGRCTWACLCLKRHFCCVLVDVTRGCECYGTPTGGGEKGSPPPKSSGFINDGRGYFGGRGIARLPSSSQFRGGLLPHLGGLRRRKDWHLSFPPHNTGKYFGGGRTGPPPHNDREYLGGGRTGLPPHTVGVYFMHMVGNNAELNVLHSQTYCAVAVEGDRAVFLRSCRS